MHIWSLGAGGLNPTSTLTEDNRRGQSGSWLYSVIFTLGREETDSCAQAKGAEAEEAVNPDEVYLLADQRPETLGR